MPHRYPRDQLRHIISIAQLHGQLHYVRHAMPLIADVVRVLQGHGHARLYPILVSAHQRDDVPTSRICDLLGNAARLPSIARWRFFAYKSSCGPNL